MNVTQQIDLLSSRLKHWTRKDDNNYLACCPVHGDTVPSLCITVSDSGKLLLHCFSHGCSARSMVRNIGCGFDSDGGIVHRRDIPELSSEDRKPVELRDHDVFSWPVTATYSYTDEQGTELLRVQRRDSFDGERKGFFQSTKDDTGRWVMRVLPGTDIPPYNLQGILKNTASTIFVVEGEKAAEALIKAGYTATTNPGGAGRWAKISIRFKEHFNNRHVVILPDADDPGRKHATDVALDLETCGAASIKVLDLFPKRSNGEDIVDWLDLNKASTLQSLCDKAKPFEMDPKTTGFKLPNGASFESLAHPDIVLRGRDYLVPGVILSSSLCIMAGTGGSGKSSLCGHLAAAVSQGRPAFGLDPVKDYKNRIPKGNVIWVTREEGVETELLPRLVAEGAALERIFVLREGNIDLDDPEGIRLLLGSRKPLLVILDPLTSYLSGDENSNKGSRATLEPILQACNELQLSTAFVGIAHTNKANDGSVKGVLGSVGLPNLSRSTLMITAANGASEMKITKSNFKARRDNLVFRIKDLEQDEAERVVEASGVTVIGKRDRVLESFCRISIDGWFEPMSDKDRKQSIENAQQIVKEYLEQEGGGLALEELKTDIVGERLPLTQFNLAVASLRETNQVKMIKEIDGWHIALVRNKKPKLEDIL